jgi:hypothetical protein
VADIILNLLEQVIQRPVCFRMHVRVAPGAGERHDVGQEEVDGTIVDAHAAEITRAFFARAVEMAGVHTSLLTRVACHFCFENIATLIIPSLTAA